ncbi:zinc finger BED domain-containing protein 4-like [Acanthochromis polyacanthus]|uniref:zinc finger BED domain-containing protein 4-like n=1 Tax=Acanthochromis polyacanthus TaxID=80966 RepID=UPI0022347177|nr:zinc finger BED domain-containing protein 4-like [Acanthochromis polyacanthus]
MFCREALAALNPKYKPFDRLKLSDTLVPAWYEVEKANLISEQEQVSKVAITADGWSAVTQDHYLTVTVHYVWKGQLKEKVLKTKAVFEAQTGHAVAEEINEILEKFKIQDKVVAATVDNAASMSVAVKRLQLLKFGCFAHTLNVAAQKIYTILSVSNWAARVRAVFVWMKRSHMAKIVLKEKQQLLSLPLHQLILDVRTRWSSLYQMIQRFFEQYPAIQATLMDPRIRKHAEKDRVNSSESADLRKTEEFVELMELFHTSTLCVSGDRYPTCSQIIPILQKLKSHFTACQGDSAFVVAIKQVIWDDLSKRYKDRDVRFFLEESTVMDPRRFHYRLEEDVIWGRLRRRAVADHHRVEPVAEPMKQIQRQDLVVNEEQRPAAAERKNTACLEDLFSEDDNEQQPMLPQMRIEDRVDQEVQVYRGLPCVSMQTNTAIW